MPNLLPRVSLKWTTIAYDTFFDPHLTILEYTGYITKLRVPIPLCLGKQYEYLWIDFIFYLLPIII